LKKGYIFIDGKYLHKGVRYITAILSILKERVSVRFSKFAELL